MPKSKSEQLDPKNRKTKPPKSMRKPKNGLSWVNVDRVGDWEDVVASKPETTVMRDDERALGLVKMDHEVKVRKGRLEINVIPEFQNETVAPDVKPA